MSPDPIEVIRDQLLDGVGHHGERIRRRRRRAALGGAAALVVGVVTTAVAAPWRSSDDDAVVADRSAELTYPLHIDTPSDVWGVAQPPGWDRAGRELMPSVPLDSLTLASFPLRAGNDCGQRATTALPTTALEDMGPQDALVSVVFADALTAEVDRWPEEGYSPDNLPRNENHEDLQCLRRDDLEIHWGGAPQREYSMFVLVAFGEEAPADVRDQAWTALSSLSAPARDTTSTTVHPVCVVTLPGPESAELTEAVGDRELSPGDAWYGTADLWTVLSTDGTYGPRKSVWWSSLFPGGGVEPRPDIAVTWERLDEDEPIRSTDGPGTNANASGAGWFMIANALDPSEVGCWKVTASYGGHDLSYVYWMAPRLSTMQSDAATDSATETTAELGFDPVANCFSVRVDGVAHAVVWPHGTTTSTYGEVVRVSDVSTVAAGQSFDTSGELRNVDEMFEFAPELPPCVTDSGQVWVVDSIR